jgi:hypothetical protein
MMGQQPRTDSLFYYFRLEDQIPDDHLLKRLASSQMDLHGPTLSSTYGVSSVFSPKREISPSARVPRQLM